MSEEKKSSATLTITYANGDVKTYEVSGDVYADIDAGILEIRNDNGSRFVFLPNPAFHTGKRKRRIINQYNLKHG